MTVCRIVPISIPTHIPLHVKLELDAENRCKGQANEIVPADIHQGTKLGWPPSPYGELATPETTNGKHKLYH